MYAVRAGLCVGLFLSCASLGAQSPEELGDAAARGDSTAIRLLIGRGVDPNVVDSSGVPALLRAINSGRRDAALQLLKNGANIEVGASAKAPADETVERLDTGAIIAARQGNVGILDLLREYGLERILDRPNSKRETPLLAATANCHPKMTEYLLDVGANASWRGGPRDTTALWYAANCGCLECATALMSVESVELDIPSTDGSTPLMIAVQRGNDKIAVLLIDQGADVNARDQAGLSARDYALRTNRRKIADLIEGREAMTMGLRIASTASLTLAFAAILLVVLVKFFEDHSWRNYLAVGLSLSFGAVVAQVYWKNYAALSSAVKVLTGLSDKTFSILTFGLSIAISAFLYRKVSAAMFSNRPRA